MYETCVENYKTAFRTAIRRGLYFIRSREATERSFWLRCAGPSVQNPHNRLLHVVPLLISLIVLAGGGGCGDNRGLTAPPPPPPIVKKLIIDGNTTLTAIGQTSQLTARATFSDGTVKDVTSAAQWTSTHPSVITISAQGLATVIQFGLSQILASYLGQSAEVVVAVATPPGTFVVVTGRVREPGPGGGNGIGGGPGLANVRVLDTLSGSSTLTNGIDDFSLGGLTSAAHLRFEKDAYESVEMDPILNQKIYLPMQRIVRVTAGDTVTPVPLVSNDMDYLIGPGARCFPCRLIRVVVPANGTLHLRLTSSQPGFALDLWAGGQQFLRSDDKSVEVDADVPVSAGEVIVYTGRLSPLGEGTGKAPFMLATSLTQ
jgi:hypothetical protein